MKQQQSCNSGSSNDVIFGVFKILIEQILKVCKSVSVLCFLILFVKSKTLRSTDEG